MAGKGGKRTFVRDLGGRVVRSDVSERLQPFNLDQGNRRIKLDRTYIVLQPDDLRPDAHVLCEEKDVLPLGGEPNTAQSHAGARHVDYCGGILATYIR